MNRMHRRRGKVAVASLSALACAVGPMAFVPVAFADAPTPSPSTSSAPASPSGSPSQSSPASPSGSASTPASPAPSSSAVTPVNEVAASWAPGTKSVVSAGEPSILQVKVNTNGPHGEKGVQDPLIVVVHLKKGSIRALPNTCKVSAKAKGVKSSISKDGSTLTCSLGAVPYGTAMSFKVGAIADGADGDQLEAMASVGNQRAAVRPIKISAKAGVDVYFNDNSTYSVAGDRDATPQMFFPFAVSVPKGSESLGDTVEFDINVKDSGTSQSKLSEHLGDPDNNDIQYRLGASTGKYPHTPKNTSATGAKIKVTKTATGKYHVVLSGLNTSLGDLPTTFRDGTKIPSDRMFLVSGTISLPTTHPLFGPKDSSTAATFTALNINASSRTHKKAPDVDLTNQTESRIVNINGGMSGAYNFWNKDQYYENALDGQGTSWANNGFVLPGDVFYTNFSTNYHAGLTPQYAKHGFGMCTVIDQPRSHLVTTESSADGARKNHKAYIDYFAYAKNLPPLEFHTGTIKDMQHFTCDDSKGWVPKSKVTDPSTVTAVRFKWDKSQWDNYTSRRTQLNLPLTSAKGLKPGSDMWTFDSFADDVDSHGKLVWQAFADTSSGKHVTNKSLPGSRFPTTTSMSDVVYVADHRTIADKTSDETSVNAGQEIGYTVTGELHTANGQDGSVTLTDTLPKGLIYVDGSASVKPASVKKNSDGTTTIVWAHQKTKGMKVSITYHARALDSGTYTNHLVVHNDGTASPYGKRLDEAQADDTVGVQETSQTFLDKTVVSPSFAINGQNQWDLTLANKDTTHAQDVYDIVDPLPYNGDANGSKFSGTVNIGDVKAPAGAKVYYTGADPKTIQRDPADKSNGSFGDVSKNTVGWSTTKPAHVTGIRVIGSKLAPDSLIRMSIPFTTNGDRPGDKFTNIAGARATLTQLKMVKADSATVAAEKSRLQIDKVAMPGQKVTPGGQLRYKVTVKNAGKDPVRDVKVTDMGGTNIVPKSAVFSDMSMGSSKAGSAVWMIPELKAGQTATATVTVQVSKDAKPDKDTTVNAVTVDNPHNPHHPGACVPNVGVDADTDQCDHEDIPTVPAPPTPTPPAPQKPSLQVDKVLDGSSPAIKPGGDAVYDIAVRNSGKGDAHKVVLHDLGGKDIVPGSPTFEGNPSMGTVQDNTWMIPELKAGQTATAKVKVKVSPDVKPGQDIVNEVQGSSQENVRPDGPCQPNPDGIASDTDQCDVDVEKIPAPHVVPRVLPHTGA